MFIYEKDKEPLIKGILRDVHDKRQNKFIAISGPTQRGKSRLSVKLAVKLDPDFFGRYEEEDFDITQRVATADAIDFMEIIEYCKKVKAKRGSVLIFDDAGVGMDSREWHDFQVRKMAKIMRIIGNKGWIIIFSTPNFDSLDSQARKVVTDKIELIGRNDGRIRFKFYSDVRWNDSVRKEYKARPIKVYPHGKRRKVKWFIIDEPPKVLLDHFYAMESGEKDKFLDTSIDDVRKDQKLRDELKITPTERIATIVKAVREKPYDYITEYKGRRYIDQAVIENRHMVGGRIAWKVKKTLEKDPIFLKVIEERHG